MSIYVDQDRLARTRASERSDRRAQVRSEPLRL